MTLSYLLNIIGSYNGLVPNRQHAITWSNDDTVHWYMISVITMDSTHWFPIPLVLLHFLTNDPLLLIEHYRFIQWTGAEQTTCHYTIQWWHSSLAYDKRYNRGFHSLIPYPSLSKSMQLASLGLIDNICSYNWLVPNRHYAITRANETQYWRMISVIRMDYTHWFPISLLLLHALTNDPLLLIEQYRFI